MWQLPKGVWDMLSVDHDAAGLAGPLSDGGSSGKPACFSDRAHERNMEGTWSPMREVPSEDSYRCTNKLWLTNTFAVRGSDVLFCGAGGRFDPELRPATALPLEYTATSCSLPALDVVYLLHLVRARPAPTPPPWSTRALSGERRAWLGDAGGPQQDAVDRGRLGVTAVLWRAELHTRAGHWAATAPSGGTA